MPAKKTSFKLNVSSEWPTAVVFGAAKPGAQSFINHLLTNGLNVIAIFSSLKSGSLPHSPQEHLLTTNLRKWKAYSRDKPKADYYIDFSFSSEAVEEADKNNRRLLRIIGPLDDPQSEKEFLERQNIDWRLIQAGQIYGPRDNMEEKTFLDHLFLAAVFNFHPRPADSKKTITPVFNQDLAQGLFTALFSPSAQNRLVTLAGKPISIARFWQKIATLAHSDSQKTYPETIPPPGTIHQRTKEGPEWIPETNPEKSLAATVQSFFQKIEKGEIKKPATAKPKSGPNRRRKKKKIGRLKNKHEKKKEPTKPIIIRQEPEPIREKPALALPAVKKKKKIVRKTAKVKKAVGEQQKKAVLLKKNHLNRGLTGMIFLSVILFFFPLFRVGFNLIKSGLNLKSAAASLEKGEFASAGKRAETALRAAADGKNFISDLPQPWFYLNQNKFLFAWLDAAEKSSRLVVTASGWGKTAAGLGEQTLGKQSEKSIKETAGGLVIDSEKLITELALAKESFSAAQQLLPPPLAEKTNFYQKKLAKYQTFANYIRPSLKIIKWMGGRKKLTFLVIFQNNMELRPNGGFIGSFALVNFDQGRMANFKVRDVYSADGQLGGHVEPPKPIRKYLGEGNWYLRDANWSPDFPTSARDISWFLEKEINVKPDGIIAINLEAVKKILKETGEIYLPGFNEKISDKNLFAKAEFYSEKGFFPGSSQKASFLGELFQQLLIKIKADPGQTDISQAIFSSLEEKEILAWTNYQKINRILSDNGWSGEIKAIVPARQNISADYLFINEANLGVNKANYFLKRSVGLLVDVTAGGRINHFLKINYENSNQTNAWPGGSYKNYLRVILSPGSQINNIYLYNSNGEEKTAVPLSKVDQETIKGKPSLGFLVNIPANSRKTVEIDYSQTADFGKNNWKWLFYWQKQSGFRSTPATILVSYPDGFNPLQVNPTATATSQGIIFHQFLDRDLIFGVEFGR